MGALRCPRGLRVPIRGRADALKAWSRLSFIPARVPNTKRKAGLPAQTLGHIAGNGRARPPVHAQSMGRSHCKFTGPGARQQHRVASLSGTVQFGPPVGKLVIKR